jgi:hypothetical protein
VTDADDPQLTAEQLDPDELQGEGDGVAGRSDPDEFPPTRLTGANQYGITAGEERVDEPIEERTSRDEPDDLALELDDDRAPDERRWDDPELGNDVGRLVDPGATDDGLDEPDLDAEAVAWEGTADDDLSPEESAMHVTDDPPEGDPHDGYY